MAEIKIMSSPQDLINEPTMFIYAMGKIKHWDSNEDKNYCYSIHADSRVADDAPPHKFPGWLEWQLCVWNADNNNLVIAIALIQRSKTSEFESHS
jgi:hypothetical protein